jgi:tetratricopeptide (TPR) repeat protein
MDKNGNLLIRDIIQCKGCGSIETYEITAQAQLGFTAELLRLAAVREIQPEKALDFFDTPLKLIQRVHMKTLDRKAKNISEAYHLIKGEIEKHPSDADLQRRMGNLLRNGGRPDLALPYYLEALRLNPNDAESCYCIADILIEQKQYKEAISYLARLVPLCRESKMDDDLRRDMFAALLDQAYIVEKETGHKVEVFRLAKPEETEQAKEPLAIAVQSFDLSNQEDFEWLYYTFRHGQAPQQPVKPGITLKTTRANEVKQTPIIRKKIGRNDPCPCGSGKKYKKCCGR